VRAVETIRVSKKGIQASLSAEVNDFAVVLSSWEIVRIGPEYSLTKRVKASAIRCFIGGKNAFITDETICQGRVITSLGSMFLRQRCHKCFIFYPYLMIFL
jgi:hypothetical protein